MPLDKLLFLLLLTLSSSLAFLDDVGGAFRHAGAYAKEALSYAKDLMDTAERVYEAYESVIDEECAFDLCDHDLTGLRAAPDPRHVPRANGCGTVNYLFDHTDESPVRLDPSFTECCDQHDLCYDRCGADRDLCDLHFRRCLYRVCNEKESELLERAPCKTKARLAFLLVQALGCPNYREAQKKACVCVRPSPEEEEERRKHWREEL